MAQNLSFESRPKLETITSRSYSKHPNVSNSNMYTCLWGSGKNKSMQKHPKKKLHRSDLLLKRQVCV